jgi:tetratricopeptide (TPR) repeat protein
LDSQYAAAYAGLAGVYSLQTLAGAISAEEGREHMRVAVLRALELDTGSAEAHAQLGGYLYVFEWDVEGGEREMLRAIELDPNYATAHHFYANLLAATGRVEEALAQRAIALELDPLAAHLGEAFGFILVYAGRHNEALHHLRNALELDPAYWRAHSVLGLLYETIGRPDDAIREYERANELARAPNQPTKADIARVLASTGRQAEARQLIAELRAEATATGVLDRTATALMALGEDDAAFAWLEKAYRQRRPGLPFIAADERYANMRDDPRFGDLLRRIGVRRLSDSRAPPHI